MTPEEIRDALADYLEHHQLTCNSPNCEEPVDILAYLCHCAGLHSDNLQALSREMKVYEDSCEKHSHRRN